jgi:glycosyltransferase involved in cell wall biosynthesis
VRDELVSVVVPVRDGEAYLGEALRSVLAQTYSRLDPIVVDDGSRDGTPDVLAGFGDAVRGVRQKPAGTAAAVNRGIALARGSLLAFLDADDLWTPQKLALQTAALANDPRLDLVFGQVRQFRDPDLPTAPPVPGLSKGTMLIRRESFERVGSFDTSWRIGDFVDWYARATEHGLVSEMLPDVVMLRRIHTGNSTSRDPGALVDYARVARAALDRRRARG